MIWYTWRWEAGPLGPRLAYDLERHPTRESAEADAALYGRAIGWGYGTPEELGNAKSDVRLSKSRKSRTAL